MASPVLTRLERILDLEEKQGWRNRGVIGGLQAMAERWSADASAEGLPPAQIGALVEGMRAYGAATPAERPALAAQIRRAAAGDYAPPKPAEAPEPAEPPAPAVPEAQADDDADAAPLEIPAGEPESPPPAPEPAKSARPIATTDRPGLGTVYEDDGADDDEDPRIPPPEPTHVAQARIARQKARERRNPQDLQARVTIISGVGEATAEQLARLGIEKVEDLLWHLPTRYDDFSQMRTIDSLRPGEQVTIIANLWDVRERKIGMNRAMVQGILGDSTGTLHATWWNKWIIKQLQPGQHAPFQRQGRAVHGSEDAR